MPTRCRMEQYARLPGSQRDECATREGRLTEGACDVARKESMRRDEKEEGLLLLWRARTTTWEPGAGRPRGDRGVAT